MKIATHKMLPESWDRGVMARAFKYIDDAVNTLPFFGSAAQGDILYRNATEWTRLSAGTSGNVLVTQGASANPVWSPTPNPTWNKCINGDFEFAQIGTSFARASYPTGSTTLDKWVVTYVRSAFEFTVSQQGSAPTTGEFNKSLQVACDATESPLSATTNYFSINNPIEGYNISELFGTTFTLSFWVKSTVTGIYCVRFSNENPDDTTNGRVLIGEYTVNTTNTWEYKTITVTGGLTTGGLWNSTTGIGVTASFVLACGTGLYSAGGNPIVKDTWYTPNTTPIVATNNQVNFFTNVTNKFLLAGVQINIGATASRFEHVLYGPALARVQRYCYKWQGPGAGIVTTAGAAGASKVNVSVPFPVEMRLQPSLVTTGASNMSINAVVSGAYAAGTNPSSVSLSIETSSRNGATLTVNNYSDLAVGDAVVVQGAGATAYYGIFTSYI